MAIILGLQRIADEAAFGRIAVGIPVEGRVAAPPLRLGPLAGGEAGQGRERREMGDADEIVEGQEALDMAPLGTEQAAVDGPARGENGGGQDEEGRDTRGPTPETAPIEQGQRERDGRERRIAAHQGGVENQHHNQSSPERGGDIAQR